MNTPEPDVVLLLVAAPRPVAWIFAAFMCLRMRSALPMVGTIAAVGCALNAVNACVFAALNAHYHVSQSVLNVVAWSATAGVLLTVTGGCLMIQYLLQLEGRRRREHDAVAKDVS